MAGVLVVVLVLSSLPVSVSTPGGSDTASGQGLLLSPDGSMTPLRIPFPLDVIGEGRTQELRAVFPGAVAAKIDLGLSDVARLARDKRIAEDGSVSVIVRMSAGAATPSGLLDVRTSALLPFIAGRVAFGDLPTLALSPGVERVFADDLMRTQLEDSIQIVRAPEAHERTDLLGTSLNGAGVTIAIIDTGVDYTHPDLGGCFGQGCKVIGGYDFSNEDPDPMDDSGHGTHVAATAAGANGVAPGASILAYKVCGRDGSCATSAILAAIERAQADGANIISMSLGGPGTTWHPLAQAADSAVANGVVVVSAAGNAGERDGSVGVPAASRLGIAVGATDKRDELAWFSSRGLTYQAQNDPVGVKPDIVSPGVDIRAPVPTGVCELCDPSGYRSLSGTSMATPHVAGAAAILLQAHPLWSPTLVKGALTAGAKPLPYLAREVGAGRLDVIGALDARVALVGPTLFAGVDPTSREGFWPQLNFAVANLGDEVVFVRVGMDAGTEGATATDASFAAPLPAPVPPGVAFEFDLHLNVTNAGVPDGWHEWRAFATASPNAPADVATLASPSDENVAMGTVALLKTGVVEVTAVGDPSSITLASTTTANVVSGVGRFLLPPGSFDLFARYDEGYLIREDILHEGETNITIDASTIEHEVRMMPRLANGDVVAVSQLPRCERAPIEGACWRGGGIRLQGPHFSIASFTNGDVRIRVSNVSHTWTAGAFTELHEGDAVVVTRAGAPFENAPLELSTE
ncbi:MAG: S8 family serine peptidase, partial [Candidatus Thermoplasmatota archaeon]